jgi:hypothetical protein
MIELVAGRNRDEDGDHANDATHERYHRRPHHTVLVEKGMISQPSSG